MYDTAAHNTTDEDCVKEWFTAPTLTLSSHTVSHTVCWFYTDFCEKSQPIFATTPRLFRPIIDLITACRLCVRFVCTEHLSESPCKKYYAHIYAHIVQRDHTAGCSENTKSTATFANLSSLHRYCDSYKRLRVVNDVRLRAFIALAQGEANRKVLGTCPLQLL